MKTMNFRTLMALAAVSVLSACGGGGGLPAPDSGPPAPEPADFDTFEVGDVLLGAEDRLHRAESRCTGSVCTVTYLGENVTVDLSDVDPEGDASTTTVTDGPLRNGVRTGWLSTDGEGDTRFYAFGVWGDWNAATTGAGSTVLQEIDIRFVVPTSVGQGSGTNPVSGGATWSGAMTGVRFGDSGLGAEVSGDADMTVDLVEASLDLAFTNIAELESGAGAGDIGWQGVPMEEGGFRADGLDGRFYGPDHEEAGGVFERDGIAGAFSLKRIHHEE